MRGKGADKGEKILIKKKRKKEKAANLTTTKTKSP